MTVSQAIDKNTSVTIGLVIIIMGGVVWLSSIAFGQGSNSKKIAKIESKQDAVLVMISQMQLIQAQQTEQLKYIVETVKEIKKK